MQRPKKQHIFMGTSLFCALLFLIPVITLAQTVNIPDTGLRQAINEALGKTPNASITAEDMQTLRELHAVSMNIQNLAGLEAAANLEVLRLNNNLISDLSPLTGLVKLRRIELEENVISDLSPLKGLIGVSELGLANNLISDLSPLKGLINLRGIALHHNAITDLSPLSGLIRLGWIGMSHNPLADLTPLSGLTNLHNFHGWGTPVVGLSAIAKLPKMIEQALDILRGTDDGSLTFQRTIANLEQLLALFIPEKTMLFHNYPNPFNPETWIPYQLAEASDLTLHIYAANGTLVRILDVGHQPAGIYRYRSRAAYWDGKNEVGEPIASGIYFYTLTAGDFTATRKMLIKK